MQNEHSKRKDCLRARPGWRKRLLTTLTWLALPAATTLSCGDTESDSQSGTGTIQSLDDLLEALVVDVCRDSCGESNSTYLQLTYGAECVEIMTLAYDSIGATLQTSLDAGNMSFDAEQAQRCIDLRAAHECDEAEPHCESIFVGHVPVGEACGDSDECAGNAYCSDDLACPGTCVATLDAGDACANADFDECGDGLICSGEVCVVQKADGEPCEYSEECRSWYCNDGSCAEQPQNYDKDQGEPCDFDEDCKPDLYCPEGTCAPAPAVGEPCQAYTRCVSGAYCEFAADATEGVCAARIPLGGACEDSDHCTTGVCDGGKCEKLSGLGGPCETDERCFGVCNDGACEPYPLCIDE